MKQTKNKELHYKNSYYFEYIDSCRDLLGDVKLDTYRVDLIKIFQSKWDKHINSKSPDKFAKIAVKIATKRGGI